MCAVCSWAEPHARHLCRSTLKAGGRCLRVQVRDVHDQRECCAGCSLGLHATRAVHRSGRPAGFLLAFCRQWLLQLLAVSCSPDFLGDVLHGHCAQAPVLLYHVFPCFCTVLLTYPYHSNIRHVQLRATAKEAFA